MADCSTAIGGAKLPCRKFQRKKRTMPARGTSISSATDLKELCRATGLRLPARPVTNALSHTHRHPERSEEPGRSERRAARATRSLANAQDDGGEFRFA